MEYLAEGYKEIFSNSDQVYQNLYRTITEFASKVKQAQKLTDYFEMRLSVESIYAEWRKAVDIIVNDVTVFERINQYFILRKKGYRNSKAFKKAMLDQIEADHAVISEQLRIIDEAKWLYEKFGEGEYTDIPGLCRAATLEEI